jgi:hypothetical protein
MAIWLLFTGYKDEQLVVGPLTNITIGMDTVYESDSKIMIARQNDRYLANEQVSWLVNGLYYRSPFEIVSGETSPWLDLPNRLPPGLRK